MEQQEIIFSAGGNAKWFSHFGRVWQFLKKLNIVLLYGQVIVLLGVDPNKFKTYAHTKICTWMFIATLFISVKKNEATEMVFHGKWKNKPWYIHTTEYSSTIKRNELSSYRKTRQNLKCTLLHEEKQSEKAIYCMIPTRWPSVMKFAPFQPATSN